jgi:hypothetical protein
MRFRDNLTRNKNNQVQQNKEFETMRTAAVTSDDMSRYYGFNRNSAHFQGNGLTNNTKVSSRQKLIRLRLLIKHECKATKRADKVERVQSNIIQLQRLRNKFVKDDD